jgi:guanosine-3',5'-bis(diphosphate) 3'-pyrophosphohydrolase
MKQGKMLNSMLLLATRKHADQYDKGGHSYILHCLAVMQNLNTDDEELLCIALGHDIVEDTDTTYQELLEHGMTHRVIDGIAALTKLPGETKEDYKARVKNNPDAVIVKMADLQHNSDIRRLKGVSEKDITRMISYHNFYLELKSLRESGLHLLES